MSKSVEKVLEAKGWKSIEIRAGGKVIQKEEKDTVLAVREFVTEPASVSREYGLTINLGNFESARVTVGVVLPCYREEINDANDLAKKFCEAEIQAEVAEIKSNKPENGKKPI